MSTVTASPARHQQFLSGLVIGETAPHMATPCIVWTRGRFTKGYGSFKVGTKSHYAHRYAWESAHGAIPDGLQVMHACDNRVCCNVEHLSLGTVAENNADRDAKGRQARGERCATARLTTTDVRTIRATHNPNSRSSARLLSSRFEVSVGTIRDILHRRTWRHLSV